MGSTESLPTGSTNRPVEKRAGWRRNRVLFPDESQRHEDSGSESRKPVGRDSVEPRSNPHRGGRGMGNRGAQACPNGDRVTHAQPAHWRQLKLKDPVQPRGVVPDRFPGCPSSPDLQTVRLKRGPVGDGIGCCSGMNLKGMRTAVANQESRWGETPSSPYRIPTGVEEAWGVAARKHVPTAS